MSDYAIFPFGKIKPNSRIVIYGAGLAGKNMYLQVRKTSYCEVVCLVDKNADKIDLYEVIVNTPEYLKEFDGYDYIIVSLINEKLKHEVEQKLLNDYCVPKEKLIIPRDNVINWEYGFSLLKEENSYAEKFPKYLKKVSAKAFVSADRIDIAVRYLLFRDFINRVDNPEHLSLFRRYVMIRTGGYEVETLHSPVPKHSVDDYVQKGRELCRSIQEKGFIKDGFVPINDNNEALDGLHRIAAAIVCDEDVYAHEYFGLKQAHVDFSFFEKNRFTFSDRISILRAFCEMYPGNVGCLVLFSPCAKLWGYIEEQLKKLTKVVGVIDFDFEKDYVCFENVIREIYYDPVCKNDLIQRKLNVLKYDNLSIRLIVIDDENGADDFYEKLRLFKLDMRKRFSDLFYDVPIVMHTPDTKEEFLHLRNIFLSSNNIRQMGRKVCQRYTNRFIQNLNELGEWCEKNHVTKEDIIIVGSGCMEVFGIRESHDIDFTIMPEYRKCFNGNESVIISETLEMTHRNFACDDEFRPISDEVIITDDNYYFYFYGFKFLNLEYLLKKKKKNARSKDLDDVRLIELFLEWDSAFEKKEVLRERIQDEMLRRRF